MVSWLPSTVIAPRQTNCQVIVFTTMVPPKYYTLWSKPCITSRKTLNVYPKDNPAPGSSNTKRLTAVKETLYNPMLPTLRRMDMDEVLKRLPAGHSRFISPLTKGRQK